MRLKACRDKLADFLTTLGYCLELSWDVSKFYTIFRIGTQAMIPILTIVASLIGKYLIDLLTGAWQIDGGTMVLIGLFGSLLLVALLRALSQKVTQYSASMHNDMLDGQIRLMMMERAMAADLEYFDNSAYYDKLMAANRDSYAFSSILWSALSSISASISFFSAFIVLCNANWLYGLMMMIAGFPSSIAAIKYTKTLFNLSVEQLNGERQKGYLQQIAMDKRYAQDVRLFHMNERLKKRYDLLWRRLFSARQKATRTRTIWTGLLECLPEVVVVGVGIHIAFSVMENQATVGDYSLYTGMVSQLWGAISLLSNSVMQIYDNKLKIANLKDLESFKNRVKDNGTRSIDSVDSIEFEHVYFTYPGSKIPALSDVNFVLHREEKVALVGLNGSGKSTLIKLLLRLYDPDSGVVRINGIDIKEYKLRLLRDNFSVYFQEMPNYSFTIRENLTIADDGRDDLDKAAYEALRSCCCEDILKKASKGLDTNLTRLFEADGIELSGGEHQRLALARAFYRRHTALILDEPSSSLDPKAEHEIFEALRELTKGKMSIFTSHRLSNVFLADRIIVLEEGKVVEDGTQQQLIKNEQRYAELFRYQQEKYVVGD